MKLNRFALISLLLAITLAGCSTVQKEDVKKAEVQPSAPAPVNGIPVVETSQYTNDTFGYSFSYPKSAEISEQKFNNGPTLAQQSTSLYLGNGTNVAITVYRNGESEQFNKADIRKNPAYSAIPYGNQEALQSRSLGTGNDWFVTTVIYGNAYIYTIEMSTPKQSTETDNQYVSILGSFTSTK